MRRALLTRSTRERMPHSPHHPISALDIRENIGTIWYHPRDSECKSKSRSSMQMKPAPNPEPGTQNESPVLRRILSAAFETFTRKGYAETSTLEIATKAKVSKRDLYANFTNKHAMLVACISNRTARMRRSQELPMPHNREALTSTLTAFAHNVVREVSDPKVVAMFRLAVAEANRSPQIARTLETAGRQATQKRLTDLLRHAKSAELIVGGEPSDMAVQFMGLVWEGLMVSLLLGVATTPGPAEIERRAIKATEAFLALHPQAASRKGR
jgi:AcrR family transcriptional regulator